MCIKENLGWSDWSVPYHFWTGNVYVFLLYAFMEWIIWVGIILWLEGSLDNISCQNDVYYGWEGFFIEHFKKSYSVCNIDEYMASRACMNGTNCTNWTQATCQHPCQTELQEAVENCANTITYFLASNFLTS